MRKKQERQRSSVSYETASLYRLHTDITSLIDLLIRGFHILRKEIISQVDGPVGRGDQNNKYTVLHDRLSQTVTQRPS